ncbi:MAG: 2-dehydropantoate 2-reductase [Acidilobaceae archaeon]|nr:2-dehydropantoate 2-reductase [Acidilobaceae archaeon]
MKRRFCIFGLGAVGGLLGLFLWRAGEKAYAVVRRREHAERLVEEGMRVSGLIEGHYFPEAGTSPPEEGCLYSLIATKAYDAKAAIAAALPRSEFIATFSNGLVAMEEALSVGARAVGGIVEYGAVRRGDSHVEVRGLGRIVIGSLGADPRPLAEALRRGGAVVEEVSDVIAWAWLKLAANATINPITALLEAENGVVLEPSLRPLVECAAREVGMIASALGLLLPEDPVSYVLRVAEATRNNTSSMLADIQQGRRTEVEELSGYVLRTASRLGLRTDCNAALYYLVKAKETLKGSRGLLRR